MFNVTPTGSYKLDIEFKRLPIDKVNKWPGYLIVCLPTPGSYCALTVNCTDQGKNYNGADYKPKSKDERVGGLPYHPGIGKKHTLQVVVTPLAGGQSVKIEATLNGEPITRWAGPSSALKGTSKSHKVSLPQNIGVGASSGGIKFYKVNFSGRHKGG